MSKVQINTPAPDFELPDFDGQALRLSELWQRKLVVLVFNRGFV